MKHILLVFTGGTIGSCSEHGIIDPSSRAKYQLLELFRHNHRDSDDIQFTIREPFRLLSENLQPGVWERLIGVIEAEDPSAYDGIIVTHGTDTLAFSAAALGLYFHSLAIPLLLVSSNRPLSEPQANGLDNFICAVHYIVQRQAPGVFVPYKNPGQAMHVHIATRLLSSLPLSGDFISVQSKPFMHFADGRFTRLHDIETKHGGGITLEPRFSDHISQLMPYPGLDYSRIALEAGDIILHGLYHSGTACAAPDDGDRHSLSEFIRRCREQSVKIYLAPAIQHDALYSSTETLLAQGVTMLWNLSLEAACVKLMLAYGNFDDEREISDFLQQDIAMEHI